MNVAVTGASGFIGGHVVSRFAEQGHRILALGRDITRLPKAADDAVDRVATDYSEKSLRRCLEDQDAVVHLAAQREGGPLDDATIYQENVNLTRDVLSASKDAGIDHVIQASSISVYLGSDDAPYEESQRPVPATAYGASKIACETLGDLATGQGDLEVTSLRLAHVFGRGEDQRDVLTKFIGLAQRGEPLPIWGKGRYAGDFLYVEDAASAFIQAIRTRATSGMYNIGGGRRWSVREIASAVNEIFDNQGNVVHEPDKDENARQYHMDCTKARDLLDWDPPGSLVEGLRHARCRCQEATAKEAP